MTDKLKTLTVYSNGSSPFKKAIAFNILFLGLGAMIGTGIITAVLIR